MVNPSIRGIITSHTMASIGALDSTSKAVSPSSAVRMRRVAIARARGPGHRVAHRVANDWGTSYNKRKVGLGK